ncbi:MAG: AAA family ATPase [Candidatus Binatia bacterium]
MSPIELLFPPFRLDLIDEQLWNDGRRVPLRPKAFAVLRHLAERAGRLVTKEDLAASVWRGTSVVSAGLKVRIAELRQALGDDPDAPRFIETVARRGYRFIAPVATAGRDSPRGGSSGATAGALVGRQAEIARLDGALAQALAGERRVVYVTGEAGIGKTTLVQAFLARAVLPDGAWVAQGQCVEQYGSGEAYLPVLEALGGLCRGAGRVRLPAVLRQYAPTWLVQLPWLLPPVEREALLREVQGVAQERMLREMADTIEVVCAEAPLVLVLEDLHWSDYSTLDLLSLLTHRRAPARLLVIATYRPIDAILSNHPVKQLKQDFTLRGLCAELALEGFTAGEVRSYLAHRFPPGPPPAAVAAAFERTDGNPLFLAAVADDLATEGVVAPGLGGWRWQADAAELGVPPTIRQLLERQIERLTPEERRLLEAASAVGMTFSGAAIAAALDADVADCDERCGALARRAHLIKPGGAGEWPDGTPTAHYTFTHSLHRRVLHDGLAPSRRSRLHALLGERTQAAWGARAQEVAAELAVHFEEGRDPVRAVHYLLAAAGNAGRRSATREAVDHLLRAEQLLAGLPEGPERLQTDLQLQMALGPALMSTRGYAAPEVERAFTRARTLCEVIGPSAPLFPALWGIWGFHVVRGEMGPARELADQCFALASDAGDPDMLLEAHHALWVTKFFSGELAPALDHVRAGLALYRPEHRAHVLIYGQDPAVAAHSYGALLSWYLGDPDGARQHSVEALALGRTVGHPFSLGFAHHFVAWVHYSRGDFTAARTEADTLYTLATEQGFPFWSAGALQFSAWAMIRAGDVAAGIAQMRAALDAWRATGAGLGLPSHLGRLAEGHLKAGELDAADTVLAEAFAGLAQSGQRYYEAELHRLHAELVLARADASPRRPAGAWRRAAASLTAAVDVARRQGARWLELRATTSLARLCQRQGDDAEARRLAARACRILGDDADAPDAAAAHALRAELRRGAGAERSR